MKLFCSLAGATAALAVSCAANSPTVPPVERGIASPAKEGIDASFDIVRTEVRRENGAMVFRQELRGEAGKAKPTATGKLQGSEVFSYVWPTTIDSATVGFEAAQGILAFALTAHPDFDDTPLEDENGDGNKGNDGGLWHSHWVVLTKDASCGGGLKVRDIPEGAKPILPPRWPGLPLLIDSPGYAPSLSGNVVEVRIPESSVRFPAELGYDGVTAALRVNADLHQPLLCVARVDDVASGALTLPGKVGPASR